MTELESLKKEIELLRRESAALKVSIEDIGEMMRMIVLDKKEISNVNKEHIEYVKPDVACSILSCSRNKLYSLVRNGDVIACSIGGKTHKLYSLKSIKNYMMECTKVKINNPTK
jgi:hypothetical protein